MRKRSKEDDLSVISLADRVRKAMPLYAADQEVMQLSRDICFEAFFSVKRLYEPDLGKVFRTARLVFCTLRCELEILQDIADDAAVTEIMVNGPDAVFIEKGHGMEKADVYFETGEQLQRVIQRIAAGVGREINELNPIVDARLSDGSRVNAVYSNVALDGPVLTIRKFTKNRMTMDDLVEQGDISRQAADLLELLVGCRYNIFVSGGTSSGKTTFLNVLSDFIPPEERVIVIEDSAELQIRNHQNLVRLEAKAENSHGKGGVSIKDLIKTSLRMRPDRIIVGEVRGAEAADMLAAMSTGHDGSLSTGHANSAAGMIGRLEAMFLSGTAFPLEAVRKQISQSIDLFVHLARMPDGHRRVVEISEVIGIEKGEVQLSQLYRYTRAEGLKRTKAVLCRCEKVEIMGKFDRLQELQTGPEA